MKSRKILLPLAALFAMTIAACNSSGVTPSYTVTFDSKGGSQVESQTVEKGKTATKPTNPTKANLTFGEWYKEEAYTNAFDFTSPIEADLTLYARWVCTVTFNSKGGSAVRKQEVNEGGKATKPTDPTKSGYDFVNWYSDEGYETVFDFANTTLTGNITLYAKWTLSVSPVLLSSVNPNVIDGGDTEFSVWTPSSNFVGHNIQGWATGNTFETSWRTMMAVDSEGRLCYAVWCAANGYGVPKEYSYVCHEYYSKDGVGYLNNPAFKFGDNYAANNQDWQLVVPEGGFLITGHTNGANTIDSLVTGGKFNLYGGDDEALARSFNQSHCEFSTRSFKFQDNKVEAYDLATHVTYTGTKSGAFTGNAATATYSKDVVMYEGDTITLNFFDGVMEIDLTDTVATFTGDYTSTRGGDGTYKMYAVSDETKNVLVAGARGKYQFSYNYTSNTLNITYVETLDFYVYLVNVLGDESSVLSVKYNEAFVLPTPENPTGYTFSRWVNGKGQTVTSGTYSVKDDMYLYAVFTKTSDSKEYAYTGKQPAISTSADSQFTVLDDQSGFIAHSHEGWNEGCTWNMSWRTFAVVDSEGRICYAVWCAANGYGGPKAYTYHCDSYYSASGVTYENNPAFIIDPDLGDWPDLTPDGRKAWELFQIVVPSGGHIISTYDSGADTLVSMLSSGELIEAGAELNKVHNWNVRFDISSDGTVYSRINLA